MYIIISLSLYIYIYNVICYSVKASIIIISSIISHFYYHDRCRRYLAPQAVKVTIVRVIIIITITTVSYDESCL